MPFNEKLKNACCDTKSYLPIPIYQPIIVLDAGTLKQGQVINKVLDGGTVNQGQIINNILDGGT